MKNYEMEILEPRYDSRKSFYRKAYVCKRGKELDLYSYDTLVAIIDRKGTVTIDLSHSITTNRHIKEFLKQNGFVAETKKQMLADYKQFKGVN